MFFEIDRVLNFSSDIPYSRIAKDKDFEIYIFGDLMGAIYKSKKYYQYEAFQFLVDSFSNKKVFESFFRTLIGKCIVVIKSSLEIKIYVSPSSSGLFYMKSKNKIKIFDDESYVYKQACDSNYNELELLNIIISHQGLMRMPFSTPVDDISRLIGGCKLVIENDLLFRMDMYILKDQKELKEKSKKTHKQDYKEFENLLNGTVEIISSFYKDHPLFLAKSGGVDSSVLLAALSSTASSFSTIYIPYGGNKSTAEKVAKSISSKFNVELNVMPLIKDKNEKIKLIKNLKQKILVGLGFLIGPQYLKVNQELFYKEIKNENNHETVLITGQNLDSLYFLDTFSPGSFVTGLEKFITSLNSVKKRIYFSDFFLNQKSYKSFFSLWPFKISKNSINKNFKKYLISYVTSTEEHVVPFSKSKIIPKKLTSLEHDYRMFKVKKIIDPIVSMYIKKSNIGINFEKLELAEKNHLIRITKWCRFVQNCHTNYHNLRKTDNVNRITPFSEGPLTDFFLTYQLKFSDSFLIKRFCKSYLKLNHDFNYSSFVKKFTSSTKISIFRAIFDFLLKHHLTKYVFTKIAELIFPFRMEQRAQNKKDLVEGNKDSGDLLNSLNLKSSSLDKYFSNRDIKRFINDRKKVIEEGNYSNLSKSEYMQLCRMINLENLLQTKK